MNGKWRIVLVFAAIAASGCAAIRRNEARDTGDLLVAAGFRPKPADTPERVAHLQAMPALKMVADSKDGNVVYRYADPYSCECLYVGDEDAYREYKRLAVEKEIADEKLQAAQAAEAASMDWGL